MSEPKKEFTRKNFQALHEKGWTDVNIASEFGITILEASKARKRADFWGEDGKPRKVEAERPKPEKVEEAPTEDVPPAPEEPTTKEKPKRKPKQ